MRFVLGDRDWFGINVVINIEDITKIHVTWKFGALK